MIRRFGGLATLWRSACAPCVVLVSAVRTTVHRRNFQPFSQHDEEELVKVISAKPHHVLKRVRQLVWRSRKKELYFRNTVTQLMIVIQDFLRKQQLDPTHASNIMEGVMEECIHLSQHDLAHLLFRAFLRFQKYGCKVSVVALRHLFDSYKGTDNKEMMLQLATEMKDDPAMRAFCIAAFLFAGSTEDAQEIVARIPEGEMTLADISALIEGYSKLNEKEKLVEALRRLSPYKDSEHVVDAIKPALQSFYKTEDEESFEIVVNIIKDMKIVPDLHCFATVLRMRMKSVRSFEDIRAAEEELEAMGYIPDMTGNSILIAAYARLVHYGDRGSEEVMLAKVDTLLSSIEARLKQGDPDMDISAAHLRAVIRGYGAAGRPELMNTAWSRMKGHGLSSDTRVYNELLKWFSLIGNVRDVLRIKEEMSRALVPPDAATYMWIFRALGKWYPRQVDSFYEELHSSNVRPDMSLYATLIGVFGDLNMFDKLEKVAAEVEQRREMGSLTMSPHYYAQMIRVYSTDLDRVTALYNDAQQHNCADHPHVITLLVSAFAKKGEEGHERLEALLVAIPHWSTNVYNVLLHSYGKQGDKQKVQQLLDKMRNERVEFDEVTYGTLVTVFGRWKDSEKIHETLELLKSKEGQVKANFYSVLAATYSRLGDVGGIDDAWEDLQSSKLFPDTETYNQFLALYGKHSNVHRMQVVMDHMLRQVPPNPLTATTVVDMLGKSGRIADMEALLQDMNASPDTAPTAVTYHHVMNAYAKTGDVGKMEKVREEMMAKGVKENVVTFNILADGYGRAKRFEQLSELLQRRKAAGIPMDEIGYCVVVSVYGRARMAGELSKIAEEVRACGDPTVYTTKVVWTLIDAFCRLNDVPQMQVWISELQKLREPQGLSTGDQMSLIAYYCRAGMMDKVEGAIQEIEAKKLDLSFGALNALARGYARSGRFDKTVEVLHKMRDRNFVPDASTALALSTAFLRAGLHEQAQQIVQWRRQYASAHVEEEAIA